MNCTPLPYNCPGRSAPRARGREVVRHYFVTHQPVGPAGARARGFFDMSKKLPLTPYALCHSYKSPSLFLGRPLYGRT